MQLAVGIGDADEVEVDQRQVAHAAADQRFRGDGWLFSVMGVREDSYHRYGVERGWLMPGVAGKNEISCPAGDAYCGARIREEIREERGSGKSTERTAQQGAKSTERSGASRREHTTPS